MITRNELIYIRELLEALQRECKTDALYSGAKRGIDILVREMKERDEHLLPDMDYSGVIAQTLNRWKKDD